MKDSKRESPGVATVVTPVLSAAVVVLREAERGMEVLLRQRNNKIKVHGGMRIGFMHWQSIFS